MQITLTRTMLAAKGACDDAAADLEKFFGSPDNWTVDWTPAKQIEVLKSPLRKYFGWGWHAQLYPMWSLSRADLSGASLSGADLSRADLSGASLSRADLSGTSLFGADLSRASLYGADLSGASLSGADLSRADLSGASLYGADLYGADLSGASLYGASLYGASLDANLAGAKVCSCDLSACAALRATLEAAGWKPGSDGLLEKIKPPPAAVGS